MASIQRHDRAPYFRLKDQSGARRSLDQYHGRNLVLLFYDHDDTPETVQEVAAFGDAAARFAALHTDVIGVCADPPRAHRRFAQLHHVNFPLLSDRRHRLAKAVGVFDNDHQRTEPTTVIIDADGRVEKVYEGGRPDRHAEQVLQHLAGLDRAEHWPSRPA